MNAVLWWKEYRQQRAVWLAIAIPAAFQLVAFPIASGVAFGLAMVYGIVAGAMLLAGEKEDGVLVFLDSLTGRRGPLWTRKVVAGLFLTLSLALILAGLAMVGLSLHWHDIYERERGVLVGLAAMSFVLLSLDGLVWGLLGGALCSNVLNGALVGILFMGGSWALCLFSTGMPSMILIKAAPGVVGLYASWRIYCRDDRSRGPIRARLTKPVRSTAPGAWRVLWWLALRQGRWVLIGGAAWALLLGCIVNMGPLVLWPLGTLLLGLTCGLCAFAPDQNGPNRFLGSQRIPARRMWRAKVLFWATALFALLALVWYVATAVVPFAKAGFLAPNGFFRCRPYLPHWRCLKKPEKTAVFENLRLEKRSRVSKRLHFG